MYYSLLNSNRKQIQIYVQLLSSEAYRLMCDLDKEYSCLKQRVVEVRPVNMWKSVPREMNVIQCC